jgi:hypothetical protein
LFEVVKEKAENQFDDAGINIVWFVSRNALFRGHDVFGTVAYHYAEGWDLLGNEQPGKIYSPPNGLAGIAWSFDGPDGSHTFEPEYFVVESHRTVGEHFRGLKIPVLEIGKSGTATEL